MRDVILKTMKLDTWLKTVKIDGVNNIRFHSTRTDITYNHIWNIYKHFKKCGIIHMEKVGREHKIRLTEKGIKLKSLFEEIDKLLEDTHGSAERIANAGH